MPPKNWSVESLFSSIDKRYKDVEMYFINDVPYHLYAENMYNNIALSNLDIKCTLKEMLGE